MEITIDLSFDPIGDVKSLYRYWVKREYSSREDLNFPGVALSVYLLQSVVGLVTLATYNLFEFKMPTEDNLQFSVAILFLGVLAEEFIFRVIPLMSAGLIQWLFGGRNIYWFMGVASSLVFGIVHLTNFLDFQPQYLIIIVNQTFGGLVLYWIADTWDIRYAIGYHFLTDCVAIYLSGILA